MDIFINLLIILIGLYFSFRFRYLGKTAIHQRKQLNNLLPFSISEGHFDNVAVIITQGMFLFIGVLFIIVGFTKLWN